MTSIQRHPLATLVKTVAGVSILSGFCSVWASAENTSSHSSSDEKSVNPGINARYLEPQTNVTEWVERFEREGREVYSNRQKILETIQVRPGSDVADIGSGTGLFTLSFGEAVGSQGTVYAVDIVKEFLEHIDQRAKSAGLRNIKPNLCTERSIELAANSIDLAFICDVYHHFEYPQSSLASIYRALRPGGEIVLIEFKRIPGESSEWMLNHVRAGQEVFTEEIKRAGFEQIEEYPFLKDNYMLRFRKTGSS